MAIHLNKLGNSLLAFALLIIYFEACATTLIKPRSHGKLMPISSSASEVEKNNDPAADDAPFSGEYNADTFADEKDESDSDEPFTEKTGFIVLVVVLAVVVVVIIIVLLCCCCRKKGKKNSADKLPEDDESIESERMTTPIPTIPVEKKPPPKIVLMNKPEQKKPEQKPEKQLLDNRSNEVIIPASSQKAKADEISKAEIVNELQDEIKDNKDHVEDEGLLQKSEIVGAKSVTEVLEGNESLRSASVVSNSSKVGGDVGEISDHEDHALGGEDSHSLHDEINAVLSGINEILSVEDDPDDNSDVKSDDATNKEDDGHIHGQDEGKGGDQNHELDQTSTPEPSLEDQVQSDSDRDESNDKGEHNKDKIHQISMEDEDKEKEKVQQSFPLNQKDPELDNFNKSEDDDENIVAVVKEEIQKSVVSDSSDQDTQENH